jgi:hypothetical protein
VVVSFLPVFGDPRRVVADPVGKGVPKEVEPRDQLEVLDDPPGRRRHVAVGGPLLERFLPGALGEERLYVAAVVLVAAHLGVFVLVGVDGLQFGWVRRLHVECHIPSSVPGEQNAADSRPGSGPFRPPLGESRV